jgi:hypothetical protein
VDRMTKVNLQIVTLDVPPQDVITKDNVTVRVNAVIYFQVFQPVKAVVEIQNYLYGTSQIAQTTLRAVLCKVDLDEILTERDRLNSELQRIIDDLTDPWGVKVALVEIKDVDLPQQMQRAMARQAEAERERRAKIINAEGEFQASERLAQAAEVIARHPIAYQLRYLQTVNEVAAERNSTLVIPIPIELLKPFEAAFGKDLSTFEAPLGSPVGGTGSAGPQDRVGGTGSAGPQDQRTVHSPGEPSPEISPE